MGGTNARSDGSVDLVVGSNTVTVEVTAQDGQTKNLYVVTVTRPVEPDSDDATLGTLTLTNPKNSLDVELDPMFTPGDTYYENNGVGNDVTHVVVVAKPTDSNTQSVQLQVDGTDSGDKAALADGVTVDLADPGVANVLTIKVTAEDGNATETYTIKLTRNSPPLSGVTTLYSLVLRDLTQTPVILDPEFVVGGENGTSFAVSVDHGVTKVEVIAAATDTSGASVEITGADPGGFVSLNVGDNTIEVVVTAQDVNFTQTHTVTVTRGRPLRPTMLRTLSFPDGGRRGRRPHLRCL